VNGRSRSSVTADRKVELTAAVSLAATTGGLFFLADEGQDEGAAVRRGAVLEQGDALCSSSGTPSRISAGILRDWGNVDSLCG
jgi:hypothetical protein